MPLTKKEIATFRNDVYLQSEKNQRSFPWRETDDPYKILVSEFMLQQTQTSRVEMKYPEFIAKFPNMRHLSSASKQEVLGLWQGLGYNRRALNLHESAKRIEREFNGNVPKQENDLLSLPGIGPYTASAIRTFAFNQPSVMIETNIRTVYIHHFFEDQTTISDKELEPFILATIDSSDPRSWYYSLMDYGVYLKKTIGNLNVRSTKYTRQSKFEGSNRQKRGEIVRRLTKEGAIPIKQFPNELLPIIDQLETEGFLTKEENVLYIAE